MPRRGRLRLRFLLSAVLVLVLLAPLVLAQDRVETDINTNTWTVPTSAASSASATSLRSSATSLPRSSSSSSYRATSTSSTTTRSAHEVAPTVLLTDPGLTYNFTLNRTAPAFLARFANNITDRALGVILNIGQLGANDSEPLPKVIVTTEENYLPRDGRRSRTSGGSARTGYNIGQDNSWQIVWDNGFGNWTYGVDRSWNVARYSAVAPAILIGRGINDDIVLDPTLVGAGNVTVYLGYTVLDTPPGEHFDYTKVGGIDATHPYFGDSSATEALVFSPLRLVDKPPEPTYPNYTLPGAELPLPDFQAILNGSESTRNNTFLFGGRAQAVTFVVLPTSSTPSALSNSAAAIQEQVERLPSEDMPTLNVNGSAWTTVGGTAGFRDYAVFGNLKPSTNYTVWAVGADGITMSQPAWFTTKQASFNCPLLLPTSMCPGVAYASPLSDNPATLTSVPQPYADFIAASLRAFEVSVLSGACGRDRYSFISSCADCYAAYREWLCRLVLPQCAGDEVPFVDVDPRGPQAPFRLDRTLETPRNSNLSSETGPPTYPIDYVELMPCINTCTRVDQRCPSSLQWNCPRRHFNANESYAYVSDSNNRGDGSAHTGWAATDVYGNRWCNGL
ncbi:hypothetical protein CC85DRAFT_283391 [Cutaneotrichosporon oleaginosum]|uniref:FZ domain-containing protein n=1 Tax=Cutaneotrichosporon oleaginosum TaxID=879819 RepID=A0A0J0XUL3_9TREE|nr:uncharacterized protein CC85DRAFT_283391 [Cutaneotrichosporon oleaginosum]KLT44760.1 hypothetical protein CC85DRAFT_283391 [Cutaneotrichosporon oleaginosum]TXT07746.1 hypothetical protein COLE_04670 [Cutaneotrichosporon oleaginosum]